MALAALVVTGFTPSAPVPNQDGPEKVFDLIALAQALPAEHRKLASAIRRLRDAHSVRLDLSLAYEWAGEIARLNAECGGTEMSARQQNAAMAYLYSMVVLYARATKTSSNHRGPTDIRAKLTAEELTVHQLICDLRDDAIAHFGPGGSYPGPSVQKDGVFLADSGNGTWVPVMVTHRLVLNPKLMGDVERQIHRALMLAEQNRYRKEEIAIDTLNAAMTQDASLPDLLKTFATTMEAFFGSKEAAVFAMKGPRIGARRGASNLGAE